MLMEKKNKPDVPKARNFVAKNSPTSGAGAHKDKKKAQKQGDVKHKGKVVESEDNPTDIVSLDVPLLIRLLEYAREDAKTDMDLHHVAEKLIALSDEGRTLTMQDYDTVIANESVFETATAGATSAGNVSVGAVYPNKKGKTFKNKDGTVKNALDVKGANLMTGGSIKR